MFDYLSRLPNEISYRILIYYVGRPIADLVKKSIKQYKNISHVKVWNGRRMPLLRFREDEIMWHTRYERKIVKNNILSHFQHLSAVYAHANKDHIIAIKNAEKQPTQLTQACWYLLSLSIGGKT